MALVVPWLHGDGGITPLFALTSFWRIPKNEDSQNEFGKIQIQPRDALDPREWFRSIYGSVSCRLAEIADDTSEPERFENPFYARLIHDKQST